MTTTTHTTRSAAELVRIGRELERDAAGAARMGRTADASALYRRAREYYRDASGIACK
jgi:hypothetical protein